MSAGANLLTAPFRDLSPRRHRATRAERRLAKRLRERDPQALQDLHADLGAAVFGFLRHSLGDRGAAEDVPSRSSSRSGSAARLTTPTARHR